MSSIKFLLTLLFFPVLVVFWFGWIIYQKLFGKNQSKKAQQNKVFKQKWREHLRNFAPSRLKNKTWQKSFKKPQKPKKKVISDTNI